LSADLRRGLDTSEALRRLAAVGPNRIEEDPGPTRWDLLVRQLKDVLVLILLVAALISGVLLGDWVEAIVIVAIGLAVLAFLGVVAAAALLPRVFNEG
jgi:Ca2+-transporting ATPase